MHLIISKLDQNIIHKLDQRLDQKCIKNGSTDQIWMEFRCNIKQSLINLITSKMDRNVIDKLD